MATNEFLIFGDSGVDGVNKLSLANYTSDNDRVYGNGYTTKVIRSQLHNKVLQQTSKVSAALAQYLVLNNVSALDADSVATMAGKFNLVAGNLTDGSGAVYASTKSAHLNYFTGTAGLSTGYLSIKITGLVTATAAIVYLGFMEITITQDDRDHSIATNPASYKFMFKGNMDAGVWYNTQALLLGTNSVIPINVRFTRTATDAYIEIGETTSNWYYPTVEIAHVSSYILAGFSPSFASTIQASLLGTTATDSTILVQPSVPQFPALGSFSNLRASSTGLNANVLVSADEIIVENTTNSYQTLRAVSLTIAGTTTGANALDTGAIAASTWYSVWVIWNGTTTAGLLSLSATAPTMPTGYTYKARIGWIRTDGTANKYPLSFIQTGKKVQYKVASGSNLTALPIPASGIQGSITVPTWVAVSTANYVPSTANSVTIVLSSLGTAENMIAPNNSYGAAGSTTNPPLSHTISPSGGIDVKTTNMILESTNFYYAATGGYCGISGWEDNL